MLSCNVPYGEEETGKVRARRYCMYIVSQLKSSGGSMISKHSGGATVNFFNVIWSKCIIVPN